MLSRFLFACVLSISVFAVAQQDQDLTDQQLDAREELNKGVAAFHDANYDEAIQLFKESVRLDPELNITRLYLAATYVKQYIPGVETPENIEKANRAMEQYAAVLQRDPGHVTSIKSIAYLHLQLKHFPEAKKNYKKAADLDPADPEAFYSVGVVDWSMVFWDVSMKKSELKLNPEASLMKSPVCKELRAKELPNIEDGIVMLKKATTLRADDDDAMSFIRLLYRLRAGLDCGDTAMYAADMKAADIWADAAMAARKKNAEAGAKRTHHSATDGPR
jgi:tetratricopeptide (TPR) repeat protein